MTHTHSFFKRAILAAIAAVVIVTAMPVTSMAASTTSTANVTISATLDNDKTTKVLTLINSERKKRGLKPLYMDKTLLQNARTRASKCILYYSHTRANGTSWNTAITKKYKKAAENIAFGYDTAEEVVKAWMNSAGHRKNILNSKFTCTGIGCLEFNGTVFWTEIFTDGKALGVSCHGTGSKNYPVNIATRNLSVYKASESITLTNGNTRQVRIEVKNLGYSGLYIPIAAKSTEATTTNRHVAIYNNGKIWAIGKGTATITLKAKGISNIKKTYRVTVK